GLSRIRGPAQDRGPGVLAALFLEALPTLARGADNQRPPDRRELSRPCRGWAAGRPPCSRLVGTHGSVPEPGPVSASGLALPERRRDRDRRTGMERRGGRGDPGPG